MPEHNDRHYLLHASEQLVGVGVENMMAKNSLAEEFLVGEEVVEVRILDSIKGNYTDYWTIPDDISAEEVRRWSDPETGILSVTTIYQAGESVTYLALSGKEIDIDTSIFDWF